VPAGTGAGDGHPAELSALADFTLAPSEVILAPADTSQWASARLLDGLAATVRGFSAPVSSAMRAMVERAEEGGRAAAPVAAWPGTERRHRADDAAFLGGVYAFSENYSDTGLRSVAHFGSIVIPTLLLAAQEQPLAGRDALAAIVVGYDVLEYLGGTLNGGRPRMAHQIRGFRPTATAGPAAAVAVLARLRGWTHEQTVRGLSLACSQGGGLRPSPPAAVSAIRIQSGEALRRAIHTVQLIEAGLQAHEDMLRVDGGFFPAYAAGELGTPPLPVAGGPAGAVVLASMKLDCTPHTLCTMLDATRLIAGRRPSRPGRVDELESAEVFVPRQHTVISGTKKPLPATFAQAANHIPFCVALALETGSPLFPQVLQEGIGNESVRRAVDRVQVVADDQLTARFDADPGSWPARVEIRWRDGAVDTVELPAPETTTWTPGRALTEAARKAAAILRLPAGVSDADLRDAFSGVADWPDLWAETDQFRKLGLGAPPTGGPDGS
jgi:2-methylcitrate dehydratase PrpD